MYSNNEDRIKTIEDSLAAVKETLRNVTGSPIIKAHHGVRLDLNDDINVHNLNVMLKHINERLTALEEKVGT